MNLANIWQSIPDNQLLSVADVEPGLVGEGEWRQLQFDLFDEVPTTEALAISKCKCATNLLKKV